jgi:hypothetical protein
MFNVNLTLMITIKTKRITSLTQSIMKSSHQVTIHSFIDVIGMPFTLT